MHCHGIMGFCRQSFSPTPVLSEVVNDWYSQCQPSLSACCQAAESPMESKTSSKAFLRQAKPGVKINPFGADSETVLGVRSQVRRAWPWTGSCLATHRWTKRKWRLQWLPEQVQPGSWRSLEGLAL